MVNADLFTSLGKGRLPMRRSTTERVVTLAGVLTVVATIVLPLQPVFGGGGGARRDVVRFEKEQQHRQEAIKARQGSS